MSCRRTTADERSDIDVAESLLHEKLGDLYMILMVREVTPLKFAFPMNRPRQNLKRHK